MGELRRLLWVLRSAAGDDADELGDPPGLADLPELIRQHRDAGQPVQVDVHGAEHPLAPSVELAAFRVVQEGLTNASKHAGRGARVHIHMRWSEPSGETVGSLTVSVVDSDPAPRAADATPAPGSTHPSRSGTVVTAVDPLSRPAGGFGLLGLRERVTAVGGVFEARPTRDGFVIVATLPTTSGSLTSPQFVAYPAAARGAVGASDVIGEI
jgi:signal transduction histidine kinase